MLRSVGERVCDRENGITRRPRFIRRCYIMVFSFKQYNVWERILIDKVADLQEYHGLSW